VPERFLLATARFFPVPGKVPYWLDGQAEVQNSPESTLGVRITDTRSGARLVYAPGSKTLDDGTMAELEAADCAFVDGTFYTNLELQSSRPGAVDSVTMGHVPISGEHGIGQGKMASLDKEHASAIGVMRAIKQAIDPDNIMNPGKILKFDG